MEVFNTIVSAIELADRIWKVIDDFQKVPERLRRLQFDVKSLQQTLERLRETEFQDQRKESMLDAEVQEIQSTLLNLQQKLLQQRQKAGSNALSRSLRTFRTQLKFDDLDELATELQKRKASLSLTINMLVLGSVGNVDAILMQNQAVTVGTSEAQKAGHQTADSIAHLTQKEFLDILGAPNYAEDELGVKKPTDGTARWIYERREYLNWLGSSEMSSLHLVGKMGCGKSVLTKSIINSIKQGPDSDPTNVEVKDHAVIYYFCSCVNRTDNPSNVLKGFITQLLMEHGGIYEIALGASEILQTRRAGDASGWSFEALWHIFTKLIHACGLKTLYFIVDALDECDATNLDDLLILMHHLPNDPLVQSNIKLLFATREYTHILQCFDISCHSTRLHIQPDTVVSDIRLAMQKDINVIQKRLNLLDDEVNLLREAILDKSDGMFLWVSLATKDIMENSYDSTFETLEELIRNLPTGLKGLYEKNWVKLVESLPTAKIALANKVLTWVLLASRPMSVSELTVALAVQPGQRNVPPSKKLLRNLGAFVLHYLAPFVEIINVEEEEDGDEQLKSETATPILSYKEADTSRVRLVHQSAQEYLLQACAEKCSPTSTLRFEIDLLEGHEMMARTCIAYLCCDELQLGWFDVDNQTEFGVCKITDSTRQQVQERLDAHRLLEYACMGWYYHLRKYQRLQKPDRFRSEVYADNIYQLSIDFLKNFRDGYSCSAQARLLLLFWDSPTQFGPAPVIHLIAATDLPVVLKMLLAEPGVDLDNRDFEGNTALHYACLAREPEDHPEDRLLTIDLLVQAGIDINATSRAKETALICASSFTCTMVVKHLIKLGADVNLKSIDGATALNEASALASKEIVSHLLDAGADVNTREGNDFTPLLKASMLSVWDTARILIEKGADIDARTSEGWGCLHYAAQNGELDALALLLDAGADVNMKTTRNWTPLQSAIRFDHMDIYKYLVANGADVDITLEEGWTVFHMAAEWASLEFLQYMSETQPDINVRTKKNWTPLHFAVRRNDLPLTKFLIGKGADLDAKESKGSSPFLLAIEYRWMDMAKYLLQYYSDVEQANDARLTAFGSLCSRADGDIELAQMLISKGANPHSIIAGGYQPLHSAAGSGFLPGVKLIVELGGDVDSLPVLDGRPLFMAAGGGHLETVKYLASKGADIHAGENEILAGRAAIQAACSGGHVETVKWLIDQGADASVVRWNPILIHADMPENARFDILDMIIKKKIDINAEDSSGMSLLFASVWCRKPAIVRFALDRGGDVMLVQESNKNSIFHAAVSAGEVEMLKMVTEKAHPSFTRYVDMWGVTPGVTAATAGFTAALEHLAPIGPPESFRLSSPRQIENILRFEDYAIILDLLAKYGELDLNLPGEAIEDTVLYRVAYEPRTSRLEIKEVLKTLMKHGLRIDFLNYLGRNILHNIIIDCMPGVANVLISLGLDYKRRDCYGYNVFDLLLYRASEGWKPSFAWPFPRFVPSVSESDHAPFFGPYTAPPPPRSPIPLSRILRMSNSESASPGSPSSNRSGSNSPPMLRIASDSKPAPLKIDIPSLLPTRDSDESSPFASPLSIVSSSTGSASPSSSHSNPFSGSAPFSARATPFEVYKFCAPEEVAAMALVFDSDGNVLLDDTGRTILHTAAANGNSGVVEAVLKKEAPLVPDENGWLPSMLALRFGFTALAERLAAAELDFDSRLKQSEETSEDSGSQKPSSGTSEKTKDPRISAQSVTSSLEEFQLVTGGMAPVEKSTNESIPDIAKESSFKVITDNTGGILDEADISEPEPGSSRPIESNDKTLELTRLVPKPTTHPSKWSSKIRGVHLVLGANNEIFLPGHIACGNNDNRDKAKLKNSRGSAVTRAFSVMADAPIPFEANEYYFEVDILDDPNDTEGIAIGLASLPQAFSHFLPGWRHSARFHQRKNSSWGYHSDSGFRYPGYRSVCEPYGKRFGVGDIIGCGYSILNGQGRLWFVKNGVYQGVAYYDVKGQLYPTIGLAGGGLRVRGRLGVEPPPGVREQAHAEQQVQDLLGYTNDPTALTDYSDSDSDSDKGSERGSGAEIDKEGASDAVAAKASLSSDVD